MNINSVNYSQNQNPTFKSFSIDKKIAPDNQLFESLKHELRTIGEEINLHVNELSNDKFVFQVSDINSTKNMSEPFNLLRRDGQPPLTKEAILKKVNEIKGMVIAYTKN